MTYLVRMSEPRRSFLLIADERNPFTATSAKSFPYIEIAFRPARVLRALERCAGSCADTMREGLVVPESTVLEYKPSARLAETAPALSFVAMTSNPTRGVQVANKAKILLVWYKVGIGRVHVGLRWVECLFVQGGVKIRWV